MSKQVVQVGAPSKLGFVSFEDLMSVVVKLRSSGCRHRVVLWADTHVSKVNAEV
jgi:hypothetical protein